MSVQVNASNEREIPETVFCNRTFGGFFTPLRFVQNDMGKSWLVLLVIQKSSHNYRRAFLIATGSRLSYFLLQKSLPQE